MNRRSFFRFLGAGAATLALSEAIPFGRAWSFPSKIVVPEMSLVDFEHMYIEPAILELCRQMDERFRQPGFWDRQFDKPFRVGQTIAVRFPQHFICDSRDPSSRELVPAETLTRRLLPA